MRSLNGKRRMNGNLANIILVENKLVRSEIAKFIKSSRSGWLTQSTSAGYSLIPGVTKGGANMDLGSELVFRGLAFSVFWEKKGDALEFVVADARKGHRGVFSQPESEQEAALALVRKRQKEYWKAHSQKP